MNFVYFIKSLYKLCALQTIKRSVPNAPYLASTRDMISKVFKKQKIKKINATTPSYKFSSKNNKSSKGCPIKKPSPGSFRSSTKRKISWKINCANPLENSDKKSPNSKKISLKNFKIPTKIPNKKSILSSKFKKSHFNNLPTGKFNHTKF